MNIVRVDKKQLLKTIQENRRNHRNVFKEALEGYRRLAIEELEKMLAEAKEGRRIARQVNLIEPVDQTREYDRVIRMLKMSTDDIIELNETDFAKYVMDDWSWKQHFYETTTPYLRRGRPAKSSTSTLSQTQEEDS